MSNLGTVTVWGLTVPTRDVDGTPYIAMRSLVEAHALAWKPQWAKLKVQFKAELKELPFRAQDGKVRRMVGLPLRSAAVWLDSVNPAKTRTSDALRASREIRDEQQRESEVQAIIAVRCQHFGEQYREYPLTPPEEQLLAKAKGNELIILLGYRFIVDAVRQNIQGQDSRKRLRSFVLATQDEA